MSRLRAWLPIKGAVMLAVIIALRVATTHFGPLQWLEGAVRQCRPFLMPVTIGAAIAGTLLFVGGFLLMLYGGFGSFALRGPAWLTVLCGGSLLYVTARVAWTFWKAAPAGDGAVAPG